MTSTNRMTSAALALAVSAFLATSASAAMVEKKVPYSLNGTDFEGVLVYDDAVSGKRPAVMMAPDWMGINANNLVIAEHVAGKKYVVFVADMYGKGVRPRDSQEAGAAAGQVLNDPVLERARANKAMDVLLAEAGKMGLIDPAKTAAVGFCFGGANVLELARSGRDVDGVVTFHGDLTSKDPGASKVKARILVLQGADDPFQPQANRDKLENELRAAKVDYEIVAFGGAVHSFTDPTAHFAGKAEYNAKVARRAYAMMNMFFDQIF